MLNFALGFDRYEEFPGKDNWNPYPNAETVNAGICSWLRKRKKGRFFIYAHYMDAHHPYKSPPPFGNLFEEDFLDGKTTEQVDAEWVDIRDEKRLARIMPHARALYDGKISYLDHHLGEFFKFMRREGLAKKTLVVIVSDHGDEFLEHGGTAHYPKLYEELVRVPLIIWCPGLTSGKKIGNLVRSVDILPTILDILGLESDNHFDGVSLLPYIRGETAEFPDFAYMDAPPFRGLRTRAWKLIRNEKTKEVELYHLESDPREARNVADMHPSRAEELTKQLDAFSQSLARESIAGDPSGEGTEISEEIAERLRSLGYL